MAGNEDLFRTTKFGGYDKDEVEDGIQKIKDEAQAEITRLTNIIKDRELELSKTKKRLEEKSETVDQLEHDIKEKYQTYIDNYDNIGKLVFEAQVRADKAVKDAKDERSKILETAKTEAEKYVVSAQHEVDEKVEEGKKKYVAVQEELTTTVALMNQVQRQFMESVKSVHNIMNSLPTYVTDGYEEDDEFSKKNISSNTSSTQKLDSLAATIRRLDEDADDEKEEKDKKANR